MPSILARCSSSRTVDAPSSLVKKRFITATKQFVLDILREVKPERWKTTDLSICQRVRLLFSGVNGQARTGADGHGRVRTSRTALIEFSSQGISLLYGSSR